MPPRVVFVTHRFAHHAGPSGYDRLAREIPGEILRPGWVETLARPLPERLFTAIRRASGLDLYTRARALHEMRVALSFYSTSRRVFHFLYADNGLRYLPSLPNPRGHRIVATYHRPPSVLEKSIADPSFLSRLDAVILLGESQRPFFQRHVEESRIRVIPHGIDTSFFSPQGPPPPRPHCLFVGHYLRDFDLFERTVRRMAASDPGVRFTAVTQPRFAAPLAALPNLEIRSGVDDEGLRALYRSATIVLLPLVDAVANNTILEATACGVPVVTTDVGSVREYLPPGAGAAVTPGDEGALAAAAFRFLHDPDARTMAGKAAREAAVSRFDLGRVVGLVRATLQEVGREPSGTRA